MASNNFETGVQLFKSRNFKNAQKNFEAVLANDPKNTLALRYLGYSLYEQKEYESAKESLDRALSINPTNFYGLDYKRLAEVCMETGEPHSALKFFRTAIELEDKHNIQALAMLYEKAGDAAKEFGDLKSGIELYNEAIKLAPGANLYYNVARLYKSMERYPNSIDYFKKALEYDPENIEALYALAYLQGAQGQYDEAEQTLQQCERIAVLKNDNNLDYCRKLQQLVRKKRDLPLQTPPQRLLSEKEAKIKYLLNKFAKNEKYGNVMQLQPIVEVIGPINNGIERNGKDNYVSFLISNGSPDEIVELSFSMNLKKVQVEPTKTAINVEPGQFSELKFKVNAEKANVDIVEGQVKITSKVVTKKKGSAWDFFRTMTDIFIPFGGLMVELVRKPFTKPDASKDFTLRVN